MKCTWSLVALFVAAACVNPDEHRKLQSANEKLRAESAGMADSMRTLSAENERLRAENEKLAGRASDVDWIEAKKRELAELLKANPGLGGRGINVVSTSEGMAIRVDGSVLFAPGRNELSSEGKKTLESLQSTLQGRRVRVEGHTDDTPITRSQWGTNLRLSVERSMVVADYLIKSVNLPAEKVSVAGYGEFLPAVANTDDASRAQNRRVEILLIER
ncbi:MAG: hypothetical protein RL398_984 [Planctomycetota bacterium]|jgi:chemotaxis protein MotB